jgi:hypothetical protein
MRSWSHVVLRVRMAFVGIVALAAGPATAFAAAEPLHVLPGSPLHGPTHLHLIVSGLPPLVLDVDQRTTRSVAGVTGGPHDTAWVTPVGDGALAQVECLSCRRRVRAFLVHVDGTVRRIPTASPLVTAASARPRWTMTAQIATNARDRVALVDHERGVHLRLRWPSILGGIGGVLAQPGGPFLALTFADPAYPGPQQAEDLFLLDTRTGAITHVPGFPAQIDLKFSSMSWTHDGRLVMLLQAAGTTSVGVYRPGNRAVSLRRVRLPVRNSGSAAFVPIVSAR